MKHTFKYSAIALGISAVMALPAVSAETKGDPAHQTRGNLDLYSNTDISVDQDNDMSYSNIADVHLVKKSMVRKWVDIHGDITVEGKIEVDSAALGIVDDKQLILNNWVDNKHVENNSAVEGVDATGNTQINAGAGDINAQANDLAVAVANTDFEKVWGSADAEAFVFQNSQGNKAINKDITNTASVNDVKGSGNLHVNVTAGNFNMQKNATVIAAASGRMAEANVYDKQELIGNATSNEGIHEVLKGGETHTTSTEPDPFGQLPDATTETWEVGEDTVNWKPVANTASLSGLTTNGNTGINLGAGTNLLQANKVSISTTAADF